MKLLRQLLFIFTIGILFYACGSSNLNNTAAKEETVVIANDSLEYEIIIIDPGFTAYLNGIAQP